MHVRPRFAATAATALLLAAALSACGDKAGPARAIAAPSEIPTATASPTPAVVPSASASPTASSTPSATAAPAPATSAPAPAPAPPTHLSMSVATRGGRIDLVRGGPAQEFTVTLRGGDSEAYRHLLLTFQMEALVPEPGDTPGPAASVVLEHQDPATGQWSPAELRIANDFKPYSLYEGGSPLERGAVRTERYRLSATATGPTGSSPLMVRAVDTDAPEGAPEERERPGYSTLPHSTRRAS